MSNEIPFSPLARRAVVTVHRDAQVALNEIAKEDKEAQKITDEYRADVQRMVWVKPEEKDG